jgi:hypothetical protein
VYGLNSGVVQHLAVIGGGTVHAYLLAEIGSEFGRFAGNRGDFNVAQPADGFGMHASHETGADDGSLDLRHSFKSFPVYARGACASRRGPRSAAVARHRSLYQNAVIANGVLA